jgi:hypothetical protein
VQREDAHQGVDGAEGVGPSTRTIIMISSYERYKQKKLAERQQREVTLAAAAAAAAAAYPYVDAYIPGYPEGGPYLPRLPSPYGPPTSPLWEPPNVLRGGLNLPHMPGSAPLELPFEVREASREASGEGVSVAVAVDPSSDPATAGGLNPFTPITPLPPNPNQRFHGMGNGGGEYGGGVGNGGFFFF